MLRRGREPDRAMFSFSARELIFPGHQIEGALLGAVLVLRHLLTPSVHGHA
jgi:hypothetical protein